MGEKMSLIWILLIGFVVIGLLILIIGLWIIKKILFPKKKPKPYKIRSGGKAHHIGGGSYDVYHHHYVTKDVYVHDDDYDYYDEKDRRRGDKDDLIDKAVAFGTGAIAGYGVAEYGEEIKEDIEEIIREGEEVVDDVIDDFIDDDGSDDDY